MRFWWRITLYLWFISSVSPGWASFFEGHENLIYLEKSEECLRFALCSKYWLSNPSSSDDIVIARSFSAEKRLYVRFEIASYWFSFFLALVLRFFYGTRMERLVVVSHFGPARLVNNCTLPILLSGILEGTVLKFLVTWMLGKFWLPFNFLPTTSQITRNLERK